MKQIPFLTALLPLALAFTAIPHVCGQTQRAAPVPATIQVSGDAEIRVAPDMVDVRFGVEVDGKELLPTRELQNKRATEVIACLKKAGIEDKDIQTDFVSIDPIYESNQVKINPDKYEVKSWVSCTLRDISKFDEILTNAIRAGATHVDRFTFRSNEMRKHRDEARIAAVKVAKEKAVLLAEQLGMKVGCAQNVVEDKQEYDWVGRIYSNNPNSNGIFSGSSGNAEGSIAAGQIAISAKITVTFALVP